VASFAILGDDKLHWRPDHFGYNRWGTEVGITFPNVKLLDYLPRRQELEENPNPFATVILAHLDTLQTRHDLQDRKDRKFRLIRGLYERGWDADQVRQLFLLIDWMMDLPKDLAEAFLDEVEQYEEKKQMVFITTPERFGLERALNQGLSQGIEVSLKLKFGEPGLQLMPEIRAIKDSEKLEAILHAIETVTSPEDLRRLWAG